MKKIFSLSFISLSFLLTITACANRSTEVSLQDVFRQRQSAFGISTSQPEVAAAAGEIFSKGGNLADATVAASLAISVVRPQSTGIGGGGFLLYRGEGRMVAYDFRERAPAAATKDMFIRNGKADTSLSQNGMLASGIPGLIRGLYEFHQDSGKMPWKDLFIPAIRLAREGARVNMHLAKAIKDQQKNLLKDPALSKIFVPNGKPLERGDLFVQEELAKTLEMVAEKGPKYFYDGPFAAALAEAMKARGGIVTEADMHGYAVKKREPIQGMWRGYQILSMPPPSSGGIHLIQILQMVEEAKSELPPMLLEVEAFKRAYADRAVYLGDPDFVKVPTQALLAPDYIKERAKEISSTTIIPSEKIQPMKAPPGDHLETSHLSLMDSAGNVVSTTQSINGWFGAGVSVDGVILNNTMDDFAIQPGVANIFGLVGGDANAIAPGKTPLSSMTPTIVLDASGFSRAAIGAPGGGKIITSVYVALSRWLRDGMSPEEALAFCRFHHQWSPDKVQMEPGKCDRYKTSFIKNNYKVEDFENFGEVQLVGRTEEGNMFAVSDPRGEGRGEVFIRGR